MLALLVATHACALETCKTQNACVWGPSDTVAYQGLVK